VRYVETQIGVRESPGESRLAARPVDQLDRFGPYPQPRREETTQVRARDDESAAVAIDGKAIRPLPLRGREQRSRCSCHYVRKRIQAAFLVGGPVQSA